MPRRLRQDNTPPRPMIAGDIFADSTLDYHMMEGRLASGRHVTTAAFHFAIYRL